LIGRCRSSFKNLANGKIFGGNNSIDIKCVCSHFLCNVSQRYATASLAIKRLLSPTSTELEPGTFSQQSVQRYPNCSIRTDGQDQTASHSSQCCEGAQTFEHSVPKTGEDREERHTLRVVPNLRQTTVALTTSCPSGFVNVAFSASPRSQTQRSGLPGIRTGILVTTLCPSPLCSCDG